jgi:hypothetical protein
MNFSTFLEAVTADQTLISNGTAPTGVMICNECKTPLQEAITGNRELSSHEHVCSDCYFELVGVELDSMPIRALRINRV